MSEPRFSVIGNCARCETPLATLANGVPCETWVTVDGKAYHGGCEPRAAEPSPPFARGEVVKLRSSPEVAMTVETVKAGRYIQAVGAGVFVPCWVVECAWLHEGKPQRATFEETSLLRCKS